MVILFAVVIRAAILTDWPDFATHEFAPRNLNAQHAGHRGAAEVDADAIRGHKGRLASVSQPRSGAV
jgi:hypothetical protein